MSEAGYMASCEDWTEDFDDFEEHLNDMGVDIPSPKKGKIDASYRRIYTMKAETVIRVAKFAIRCNLHNKKYLNKCNRIMKDKEQYAHKILSKSQRSAFYGLMKDDFKEIYTRYVREYNGN